jgi:hypothetical protein
MMHLVAGHLGLRFVIIMAPGIQVTLKAGKIAAGYFYPYPVAFLKIIAGSHGRQFYFIYFYPGAELVNR